MTSHGAVVVTYLELQVPLHPVDAAVPPRFAMHRAAAPAAGQVARALYLRVGDPWQWTDRRGWTEAEWDAAIHRDDVELWIARVDDEIAGYFELQIEDASVELRYFGLLPEFTGRGLGRDLLSAAIDRAGAHRKARMTVNTCTLDHPAALPNYLRHGFTVVRTAIRQPARPA